MPNDHLAPRFYLTEKNPKDKTIGVLITGEEITTLVIGRNGLALLMPSEVSDHDIVSRTHFDLAMEHPVFTVTRIFLN